MELTLDWLRKQLHENFSIDRLVEAHFTGPNTEIGVCLYDKTQPISNEHTGYRKHVAQLRVPFLYTKDVGTESDVWGDGDKREVRDFKLSHDMAEVVLLAAFKNIVEEEISAYLSSVPAQDAPSDSGKEKLVKPHAEAITARVQKRIDGFNAVDVYDHIAIKLQVAMTYFEIAGKYRFGQEELFDRFRDRGIELFENMLKFGFRYENRYNLDPLTNGHKRDEIDGVIDYFLLRRLSGLRTQASIKQAIDKQDISIAEPNAPDFYEWGSLLGRHLNDIPDVVTVALREDALAHFGEDITAQPELLKEMRFLANK